MEGSEKQVVWATRIQAEYLGAIKVAREYLSSHEELGDAPARADADEGMAALAGFVSGVKKARTLIDSAPEAHDVVGFLSGLRAFGAIVKSPKRDYAKIARGVEQLYRAALAERGTIL